MNYIDEVEIKLNEVEELQKKVEEQYAKARFTLDFEIAGKKYTVDEVILCHECQINLRDKIEEIVYGMNIKGFDNDKQN